MASDIEAKELHARLARLIGPPHRQARHGSIFRLTFTSADGKRCSVNVGPISTHRDQISKAALGQLAGQLRVSRGDIHEVLDTWTRSELLKHLSALPAERFKPGA